MIGSLAQWSMAAATELQPSVNQPHRSVYSMLSGNPSLTEIEADPDTRPRPAPSKRRLFGGGWVLKPDVVVKTRNPEKPAFRLARQDDIAQYLTRRTSQVQKSQELAPRGAKVALPNPLLFPSVSQDKTDYVKLKRDPGSLIRNYCGDTTARFRSQLAKNPEASSELTTLASALSHHHNLRNVSQTGLTQHYDSLHSGKLTGRPVETAASPTRDLNLSGEHVAIRQSMLKVVNYEGVFDNLEAKVSQNAASRLLFSRQKAAALTRRAPEARVAPIKDYICQKTLRLQRKELESSFFRQITIKESLKGKSPQRTQLYQVAATTPYEITQSQINSMLQSTRKQTPNYLAGASLKNFGNVQDFTLQVRVMPTH